MDDRAQGHGPDTELGDTYLHSRAWRRFLAFEAWMVLLGSVMGIVGAAALGGLTRFWLVLCAVPAAASIVALAVGTVRRKAVAAILPPAYLVVALAMWSYALYGDGRPFTGALPLGVVLWLPFVYAVTFFLLPPGRALAAILAYDAAMVLLTVPHAIATRGLGGPFDDLVTPALLLLSQPLLAVSLYLFARLEPALRRSRVDMRTFQRLARVDSMTGIANRLTAEAFLDRALKTDDTSTGCLAVMLFDVDHFKRVNDAFGHAAGDDVLRLVARALETGVRSTDMAARWGGEEFIVVAPCANVIEARALAERLRGAVHELAMPDGMDAPQLTVSCGIAIARPGEWIVDLLARADDNLYRAKRGGRNRVEGAVEREPHGDIGRGGAA